MHNTNRILVTGGAGFIGSSLVRALLRSKKCQIIVVLDHHLDKKKQQISHNHESSPLCEDNSNIKFMDADMLDISSLKNAVNICDLVFHLAGNPDVRKGSINTKLDFDYNLVSTYNLLEAIRNSNSCKKLVFASTSAVYGDTDLTPVSERCFSVSPISLYAATKLACEALISGYCHIFDISAVVLRLANVIGPSSTHGVIYDFVTKLSSLPISIKSSQGYYLDVLGDGKQAKSYLFIDDCINALMICLANMEKISSRFEIFNAGSDSIITVFDIANIVIKELSLNNVVTIRLNGGVEGGRGWKGDVKQISLDSSKLEAWGWKPKFTSGEAVLHTVRKMVKLSHLRKGP